MLHLIIGCVDPTPSSEKDSASDSADPTDTAPDDTDSGEIDSGDTDSGDTDSEDTDSEDTDSDSGDTDTGGPTDLSAFGVWWAGESSDLTLSSARFIGDMDGDGTDDVALVTTTAVTPDHLEAVWFVPGGQAVGPDMTAAGTAAASFEGGYPAWPRLATNGGDIDGDGWSDLWIGRGGELAAATVVYGPPSAWSLASAVDIAGPWVASAGEEVATGLDFDGDAVPDVASFGQDDATGVGGGVYIVHGENSTADVDVDLAVRCDSPRHFAAGDLTGDGIPDLVVTYTDSARLLDGADLPSSGEVWGEDVSETTILLGGAPYAVMLGDWTGDGLDDWAAEQSSGGTDREGVVYVFAGSGVAAGEVEADAVAAGSFLGGVASGGLGRGLSAVAREEGASDLVAALWDGEQSVAVGIASASLDGLNAPLPADAWWLSGGPGEGDDIGQGVFSTGDFDGDGTDELLTGGTQWQDGRGRYFLATGGW